MDKRIKLLAQLKRAALTYCEVTGIDPYSVTSGIYRWVYILNEKLLPALGIAPMTSEESCLVDEAM